MSYNAWFIWDNFGDYDHQDKFCHKTGKKSYGKTNMAKPIFFKINKK